jgi:AAA family ATP:ADP antiporter
VLTSRTCQPILIIAKKSYHTCSKRQTLPFLSLTPVERSRFILVTLAFMCVTAAALVARTTADTLFLARFPYEHLSYMFVGTAAVVGSVAFVYSTLIGRLPIVRLIGLSIGLLIALLLLLRFGLMSYWDWVRIAAYFAGDLVVHVPIMLFWSFAMLLFDPRQAKRLFGFIGAGGTLGCILVGFVIKPISLTFGTPALVLLIAALLAVFQLIIWRLSRLESKKPEPVKPTQKKPSGLHPHVQHLKTPQIRNLISLVFVANIALALVDYQFKAGARLAYETHELAGFFGDFYALTSVIALVIQLFLVHRILNKGGIQVGLSLLPGGVLLGCLGILLTGEFYWIVITKVAIQIFLFTIDISALQMLYLGIPVASRNRARAFADGITKPIAIATAGVGLIGVAHLIPLHFLASGGVILCFVWLVLVHSNSKTYVSALIDSLGSKRFDLSSETNHLQDNTVSTYVRNTLLNAQDDEIVYLLSIASEISQMDWTPEYRRLLDKTSPEIKILALRHLQQHGDERDADKLLPLLDHPHPQVRCEAIRALSTLGKETSIIAVELFLQDAVPAVRAATIACLVNAGDLGQLIDAGVALKGLLNSEAVDERVAAALALGDIKDSILHRSLIRLLQDPHPDVQRAALQACPEHPDAKLLPIIMPLLSDPEVGQMTADVLADFGRPALTHLLPYLTLGHQDGAFPGAEMIPEILLRIGDTSTLSTLLKVADSPDHIFRHKSLQAYAKLLKKAPSTKPYLKEIYLQIQKEMAMASLRQSQLERIESSPSIILLCDALRDMCQNHLKNAFALIDALLPQVDTLAILDTLLRSETTPNNALEILDNVLPKQVKPNVIGFFERQTPESSDGSPIELNVLLSEETDTWILCGVLIAAPRNQHPIEEKNLTKCLLHNHATVIETTLYALHEQGYSDILRSKCQQLKEDPDPAIQKLAMVYLDDSQDGTNAQN